MSEATDGHAEEDAETNAWLVTADGSILRLTSPFEFGRSSACACQIRRVEVSRVHAMLQFDPVRKIWWLSDLGSQNGTCRNSQRIKSPEAMRDGDIISICNERWTFRERRIDDEIGLADAADSLGGLTKVHTETAMCWLMLIDIVGSTVLSRSMPQDQYARKLREFMDRGAQIIGLHGGVVNEYLGDAIYAFWRVEQGRDLTGPVAETIESFQEYIPQSPFKFRILLHYGRVQFGGGMSSGRESVVGEEVNFFFKSEKLVGAHPVFCGLTEAAAERLRGALPTRFLATYEVPGFPGERQFYTLA